MTTPLDIWKKAKSTFTAAVKNNKNTRKPGSWFTSGTESAIKDVMAIEYHSDVKLSPQTWMKGSKALNDKLREKYKQEKKKLHADKEKVLKTLAGVLQKKNLPEEDIKQKVAEEKQHIEELIGHKLALRKKESQLEVRKVWQKEEEQYAKYKLECNPGDYYRISQEE